MIRTIQAEEITRNIKEMCIEANHVLSDDMKNVFCDAVRRERSPLGRQILEQLAENLQLPGKTGLPSARNLVSPSSSWK